MFFQEVGKHVKAGYLVDKESLAPRGDKHSLVITTSLMSMIQQLKMSGVWWGSAPLSIGGGVQMSGRSGWVSTGSGTLLKEYSGCSVVRSRQTRTM